MSKRVGVIRGGSGGYYNESLASGKNILDALKEAGIEKRLDILVDRNGAWHLNGFEISPSELERETDVIINALHKSYHHTDNTLSTLEKLRVPITGSYKLAHSVANNRALSKKVAWQNGLSVPLALIVSHDEDLDLATKDIFKTLSGKLVLKPMGGTQGADVEFAIGINEIRRQLAKLLKDHEEIIVEEFITGKEAIVPVIEDYRGKQYYTSFPVEVVRMGEQQKYLSPGFFSDFQKGQLARAAEAMHKATNARHYSMSHFVIHPNGRVYFIKKETHPSLSIDSPFMRSLESIGCKSSEFAKHIINLA